ncbi:YkyA family protein [Bacillus sp. Marseille-P3661]|uniref:YkyA family protein n=1 Tax=Bacillus sp. Marseille-P3661 TaxID=1936234 RepID=UPI002155C878|nr:YkyA family protein [Bacillus sp. Marseille-P3661]
MLVFIKNIVLILLLILFMSGCGSSVEDEIYNHLEKAVSLESVFEQQQDPLVELEMKEQKLYEKIIQLGMSQFDEIKGLSQEALAIVEERESRIDKEKESIDASEQEFLLVENQISKIKDINLKEKGIDLTKAMKERYATYDKLYEQYKKAISLDRQLYEMFQKEDLTLQQLEEQITKINTTYDEVVKANEQFNQWTDTYNQKKKEFYNAAELNVVFENKE